jgi:hypothetical protein
MAEELELSVLPVDKSCILFVPLCTPPLLELETKEVVAVVILKAEGIVEPDGLLAARPRHMADAVPLNPIGQATVLEILSNASE